MFIDPAPQPLLSTSQLLDIAKETIPRYIETAKIFAQISAAALGLTVIFREKILGETGQIKRDYVLFGSWLAFLASIAASAIYQWAAVKWIDFRMQATMNSGVTPSFPNSVEGPHVLYGLMLFTFILGSVLLVFSAARSLLRK